MSITSKHILLIQYVTQLRLEFFVFPRSQFRTYFTQSLRYLKLGFNCCLFISFFIMNWKYLRCTEDVFLKIPLSLESRHLNFKTTSDVQPERRPERLCSAPHTAPGSQECSRRLSVSTRGFLSWHLSYSDRYKFHTSHLAISHFIFLSCKWRCTSDYKHRYVFIFPTRGN